MKITGKIVSVHFLTGQSKLIVQDYFVGERREILITDSTREGLGFNLCMGKPFIFEMYKKHAVKVERA